MTSLRRKTFAIESVGLASQPDKVFAYLADPRNLPHWTQAFKSVDEGKAQMVTPAGSVEVRLEVIAVASSGTIDWRMVFPDGALAVAHSRVTPDTGGGSVYTFVLSAPPAPLEQLEGGLESQAAVLRQELERLSGILKS
jgi:uncharacterized protein YndB with AHSA1/START domain